MFKELKASLAHKESQVLRAQLEHKEPQVLREHKAFKAFKEHKASLAHKAYKDLQLACLPTKPILVLHQAIQVMVICFGTMPHKLVLPVSLLTI